MIIFLFCILTFTSFAMESGYHENSPLLSNGPDQLEIIIDADVAQRQGSFDYEIEVVIDKQLSPFEQLPNEVHYQIIKQRLLLEDKQDRWIALKPMSCINRHYKVLCSYDVMPPEIKELLPYPYQPLTIENIRAQFQLAQRLNDQQRRDECAKFIKKHAMEALTPSWVYFGKKFFVLSSDEREALIEQRINDIIPEGMVVDRVTFNYDLSREIERRESYCLWPHVLCPAFSVGGAVIGLIFLLKAI